MSITKSRLMNRQPAYVTGLSATSAVPRRDAVESGGLARKQDRSQGLLTALLLVVLCLPAGCAHDRPINIQLAPDVRRPEVAAVVFFVDGFGRDVFDQALAEGRIPNIEWHLVRRGIVAGECVTCIPSITYAVSVSLLTGRYPGHHGIVSNKWFEPSTGRYQNYCSTETYQLVDADYQDSPTIYERLPNHTTVSIQAAMRRGCTRSWDNWASSGVNWFFSNHAGVDCLVAQRFEEIGVRAPEWGQWPDLIWAYFPALDYIGHEFGPGSPKHNETLANVDRQIGHVCDALDELGMYDRTYLCLVSDHGMVKVEREQIFDISESLRETTGARVWSNTSTKPSTQERLLSEYDLAVATTASRWSAVYPIPRSDHTAKREIDQLLEDLNTFADTRSEGASASPSDVLPLWLAGVVSHPAVEMMACRLGEDRVFLFTRSGSAMVSRSQLPACRHSVRQWPAGAILAEETVLAAEAASFEKGGDSRRWLALTAGSRYPDLIPQISALFDHERTGTLVFLASAGWDFSANDPAGGHGSILAEDMRVPMVLAGPGITPQTRIPPARICDLAPTLLHLLGADETPNPLAGEPPANALPTMDGINLLPNIVVPKAE